MGGMGMGGMDPLMQAQMSMGLGMQPMTMSPAMMTPSPVAVMDPMSPMMMGGVGGMGMGGIGGMGMGGMGMGGMSPMGNMGGAGAAPGMNPGAGVRPSGMMLVQPRQSVFGQGKVC